MPKPSYDPSEDATESVLRPQSLVGFVGQAHLTEQLSIYVEAARQRGECLDHTLFHGPPGLGKTSMAFVLGNEMRAAVHTTAGPAIEKAGDLVSLLTNLEQGDILFIDEIHRLPRTIEEILYPAMEDFRVDVMIGTGPTAKSIPIELPRFTLIGATTRSGMLTQPLRDRFGISLAFELYDTEALKLIVTAAARKMGMRFSQNPTTAGSVEIARRSRGTPRIALKLLRRVRDFAQVKNEHPASAGLITDSIVEQACKMLAIDEVGLDRTGRRYLRSLAVNYGGGPAGLEAIAASIQEDAGTLESEYEPHLLAIGFINRRKNGREITDEGRRHIDKFESGT